MNRKQLKISLVVLGLFAATVICLGLFSGTGNKTNVAYDVELLSKVEELGDTGVGSISKFKDGTYRTETSDYIMGFDKIGDVLTIEYTGDYNQGEKEYLTVIKELKKYSKTKLYSVSTIEFVPEQYGIFESLEELKSAIKDGKINKDSIAIKENNLELKVFDDEVMLNDTVYKFRHKKERKILTPEEVEELNKKWEEETAKYKYIPSENENTVENESLEVENVGVGGDTE